MIGWVTGCALAAWWQVGRAIQGNSLSYMYAVEWPAFSILGVVGWWALIHNETTPEQRAVAREQTDERRRLEAELVRSLEVSDEDSELAAYNDHLARLAHEPKRRLLGH
jgi:hypothetical protein